MIVLAQSPNGGSLRIEAERSARVSFERLLWNGGFRPHFSGPPGFVRFSAGSLRNGNSPPGRMLRHAFARRSTRRRFVAIAGTAERPHTTDAASSLAAERGWYGVDQ